MSMLSIDASFIDVVRGRRQRSWLEQWDEEDVTCRKVCEPCYMLSLSKQRRRNGDRQRGRDPRNNGGRRGDSLACYTRQQQVREGEGE
eukprot:761284-Hanusia_phi.AAC.1